MLEYVLGEQRSSVWAISESSLRMVTLPKRKDIEKEVALFRAIAAHPPASGQALDAYQAVARRLFDILLRPLSSSLARTQKLVIVPDGILHYLPFDALIRKGSAERPSYLIEEFSIVYAPSASVFCRLAADPSKGQGRTQELLAYGDPVFGRGTAVAGTMSLGDIVRSSYERGGITLPPLPNTRAEVLRIAKLFPPERRTIHLGASATEASIKLEKLTGYKRLHFATHAVIDDQAPGRSGIVLSLVNSGKEDGILRANEIFNLEMDADLVVLSACQTGLGKLVKGEGMIGLTRAFLYAGSARVLVSLWEVNDRATADFMTLFYEKMKDGMSPGAALRSAKLAMIHSGAPAYQHPYFWTPFVLVGTF